ncbi:hypothetical protein GLOTRDRAFT_137081 [Gloeophyllum trabeum ATCC 11539]|uniref:Uncharacterized protein n=1 Tax=Gloeophyllum trabeum (strain ATCC 11539 / FP-39264 / Madison 617) TaxID=670483 RepID=S7QGL7_GLOTA|nr:uncharacterized protein GLOTRDRAFT_137081 [Gloeophyllum trabeum ATCC 11539]EPQ58343.1 hypothetical protein GLOTRDRAFT_137081 [Gloeophyllum trabeum ATCC 11539]
MESVHAQEVRHMVMMDTGVPQQGLTSHHSDASHGSDPPPLLSSISPEAPGGHNPLPATMHVPDSAIPQMNVDPMDTLQTHSTTERGPPPTFIPDFPPRNGSYNGDTTMGISLGSHSSPTVSSVSSSQSYAPSPAVNGIGSAYSIGPSSLASALDGLAVPGHHSEPTISPGNLARSIADLGFGSASSGHPTSNPEAGFQLEFPPTRFDSSISKESSPDVPGGPHLMVVGDILKNIAQTASSASNACSRGHSDEANMRIDELKKTISLVSELIAATRLADGPTLPSDQVSPNLTTTFASPPLDSGIGGNGSQNSTPPSHFTPPSQPVFLSQMESQGSTDGLDNSRKRCASSISGDRVIKAMKLTKQEETPVHVPPPGPLPSHNLSTPSPPIVHPSSSLVDSAAINPFAPSNPPSEPASRPTSSAGMMGHHDLNVLSQASAHPSIGFSMHVPLPSSSNPTRTELSASSVLPPNPGRMPAANFSGPPIGWSESSSFHRRQSFGTAGSDGGLNMQGLPSSGQPAPLHQFAASASFAASSLGSQIPPIPGPSSLNHVRPLPRQVRSMSISNGHTPVFAFAPVDGSMPDFQDRLQSRPTTSSQSPGSSSQDHDIDGENDYDSDGSYDNPHSQSQSPPSGASFRKRAYSRDDQTGATRRPSTSYGSRPSNLLSHSSAENVGSSSHANELPQEYKADVDRIFFDFLNKICSDLDATDAKGEPIHQTLMAKKMQRLDESPDFRPFKFRIQAFTNAFLEELAKQGYPEEKIPMKKVRNYLWNQPYISRFNEDGKKAKSKGNHIWNIDAKKSTDGGWIFRPFHRRLAGMPPGVAYVGLRWSWTPRIWDPQGSRLNTPVQYSSPWLPTWLSWSDDVLSGTPPSDAQSCDVTVEARFFQDGKEEFLSQTVHITIAPMSTVDTSFSSSRRPSLVDTSRRVASDSILPQTNPARSRRQSLLGQGNSLATQDSQVVQVLTTAAQRVAQEAQSQVVAARSLTDPGPELQSLAKQQHVLTVTAQALDKDLTSYEGPTESSAVLAAAAHQVVFQAARQVAADKSAAVASHLSAGIPPSPSTSAQVTVSDVSAVTQTAVAQAVGIMGPLSNEVEVLMTANSLLQQQTLGTLSVPPGTLDPAQLSVAIDHTRPHSTGTLPPQAYAAQPMNMPTHATPIFPSGPHHGMEYISHS